jgi:hypothetical protein
MSEEFAVLDEQEIMRVAYDSLGRELNLNNNGFDSLLITTEQFRSAIQRRVAVSREKKSDLFNEGADCEVLKLGSKDWQKGKIRVKMIVEFCPDEPEEIEEEEAAAESQNGELEDNDFDSLDDLRKELNQ